MFVRFQVELVKAGLDGAQCLAESGGNKRMDSVSYAYAAMEPNYIAFAHLRKKEVYGSRSM